MSELLLIENPSKRRSKRKKSPAKRTYRRNPVAKAAAPKRRRRSYKRNPIKKDVVQTVMNAGIMATGAVGVDYIASKLPIPEDIKAGQFAPLVRAGVAIAAGAALEKGLKQRQLGRQVVEGSMVVIAHDTITKVLTEQNLLSSYDDMVYKDMGAYDDLLNAYSGGQSNGLLAYTQNEPMFDEMTDSNVATLL